MKEKFFTFDTAWNTMIALGFWGLRVVSSSFLYMFINALTITGKTMGLIQSFSLCLIAGVFAIFSIIIALKTKLIGRRGVDYQFFKLLIVSTALGLLITYIGVQGIQFISSGTQTTTYNQELIDRLLKYVPLYASIFTFGICTVVIEEIFYRGSIIGLVFKVNPQIGLIVSSLIFGMAHNPSDFISIIIYCSFGFIWGLAYLKSKRLELPILLHMISNIVAIVFPAFFV